jgi:hypothetical protein
LWAVRLAGCTFASSTTFLLGSANADAQKAHPIAMLKHRPNQPPKPESLVAVVIVQLCSFFVSNTTKM